jgi:hypothetical protein
MAARRVSIGEDQQIGQHQRFGQQFPAAWAGIAGTLVPNSSVLSVGPGTRAKAERMP